MTNVLFTNVRMLEGTGAFPIRAITTSRRGLAVTAA